MKNFNINGINLSGCDEGVNFLLSCKDFKTAWKRCPRGDWMLWLANRLEIDIHTLTLTKGYCVKTVFHLMKDERSQNAVIAAINYGRKLIGRKELNIAVNAAYAAADVAYAAAYTAYIANAAAYAAADVAYAAAAAANAADAAANAAFDAFDASAAASAAAYAAAADAAANAAFDAAFDASAKIKNQKKTAKICRKYLTQAVFEKLNIPYEKD